MPLKIISKLSVETPPPVLVDGYLKEIAKAYGVAFTILEEDRVEQADQDEAAVEDDKVLRLKQAMNIH